ncbi:MAG: hypothetical protein V7L26_00005, partial [Nostoc sp.]|uniref:hypothetical protein n=1 Tax=Nostoc sp. TaxID=1180 RepID=UPI002FF032A5
MIIIIDNGIIYFLEVPNIRSKNESEEQTCLHESATALPAIMQYSFSRPKTFAMPAVGVAIAHRKIPIKLIIAKKT